MSMALRSTSARCTLCYLLKQRQQSWFSTSRRSDVPFNAVVPSKFGRIRRSLLEYGIVGSIFHMSTSIMMFGTCYLIVTRWKLQILEGFLLTISIISWVTVLLNNMYCISLTVTYPRFGEIEGVLEQFKTPDLVSAAPGLNFIVTMSLYKSLFPFRLGTTTIGTWSIVRYYRCRKEKKLQMLRELHLAKLKQK